MDPNNVIGPGCHSQVVDADWTKENHDLFCYDVKSDHSVVERLVRHEEESTHESGDLEFQLRVVFHGEAIRRRKAKGESLTNYEEKNHVVSEGPSTEVEGEKRSESNTTGSGKPPQNEVDGFTYL